MNKLNKIFLIIIILLIIALGVMTYYYCNMKDAYIDAVNQSIKTSERLQSIEEAEDRKIENVEIEVMEESITSTGATIIITDRNKNPYIWREDYNLQIKDGDSWSTIDTIKDVKFNQTPFILDEDGQTKQEIDWTEIYGILPAGTYRIRKYTYTAIKDIYFESNEFEIK